MFTKQRCVLREIAGELSRRRVPRCGSDLDQLRRGASSIVLGISEGAREQQPGHKLERYRTALASASECNGALMIIALELPNHPLVREGRELCVRISAMMTKLIESVQRGADN